MECDTKNRERYERKRFEQKERNEKKRNYSNKKSLHELEKIIGNRTKLMKEVTIRIKGYQIKRKIRKLFDLRSCLTIQMRGSYISKINNYCVEVYDLMNIRKLLHGKIGTK